MRNIVAMIGAGLSFAVMIVFMFIYGMNIEGITLAACIGACFIGGGFLEGYFTERRKLHKLSDMNAVSRYTMDMPPLDMLPEPSDDIDKNYQDIIRQLYMDHLYLKSSIDRRKTETRKYYAEWERRIKVHIAALGRELRARGVRDDDAMWENLRGLERYVETALCYIEIQNGKIEPVLSNQSLDRTVDRAVERLRDRIEDGNVFFTYKPLGLFVRTDERLLIIALEEMIVTALDRTNGGSMEITGEVEDNRVMLYIRAKPVGDNRHELARLFERGLNPSTVNSDRAEGNELNVCREIFKALKCESEIMKGNGVTTIRINMGVPPKKVDLWKPPM